MEPNTTAQNQDVARDKDYDIFKRHPYYAYGAMKYLKEHHDTLDADTIDELKRAIALSVADANAAVSFVDLDGEDWAHFYPAQPQEQPVSTNNAIDTFLSNYGNRSAEQDALLERLIFNPVPDYSLVLQGQEEGQPRPAEPTTEADRRIDQFISTHPDGTPPPLATADESSEEDDYFAQLEKEASKPAEPQPAPTPQRVQPAAVDPERDASPSHPALAESLAKIYIKQHRYQRAYEIISDLSLKFPEKSIYFADQLRFLKKLIIIENFNSKK